LKAERNQRGQVLGNKGARTRQVILESTRAMILERSFRELSAVEIAKRSGLAVGTLYTYFEDVTDIFVVLVEQISQSFPDITRFDGVPWQGPAALENLVELLRIMVDYNVDNYPILRLRNHLADEGEERLARIRSCAAQPVVDLLARQIVTIHQINQPQAAAIEWEHARRIAGLLVGMIDRLTVLVMQWPYKHRASSIEDYIDSAARIILATVTAVPFDTHPT